MVGLRALGGGQRPLGQIKLSPREGDDTPAPLSKRMSGQDMGFLWSK